MRNDLLEAPSSRLPQSKVTPRMHRLSAIRAPEIVGIPPTNPIRDLMLLPDGELRHYGYRPIPGGDPFHNIYLASTDGGLSWIEHDSPRRCPGATVRSPWSGDFLTLLCCHKHPSLEEYQNIHQSCPEPGVYVHRSRQGPDGPFVSHKVSALLPRLLMPRQPIALKSVHRWIVSAQAAMDDPMLQNPIVFLSDDDGFTWRTVVLPRIPPLGVIWPHEGPRWENCGPEPTIVELTDGRLLMLIRTAHDVLWESISKDAGNSWSTPAPSRFYSTITTPLLHRMTDGRLVLIWNNTTPLPEVDHTTQPGLDPGEHAGMWEDVFTNRDALHAAVSYDDGITWRGFREIHLNDRRNDADFRSRGGSKSSLDRSIHQSQAVELPGAKLLVAFGQHPECRRMLIFDPHWLEETCAEDDFSEGLKHWSHHRYIKSVAGGFRGVVGHCSLNRCVGAALIPHPDGTMREVLQVASHPDVRLLEQKEGAVWNFPASWRGELTLRLRLPLGGQGTQITLIDRWLNPTDPVVAKLSQFVIHIDPQGTINGKTKLLHDEWKNLIIRWNLPADHVAFFSIDGCTWHEIPLATPTVNGPSYLHIQSMAPADDLLGLLVESVHMRNQPSRR